MQGEKSASRSGVGESDARLALACVLASHGFAGSVRLQRFLTYVVNETLAGRGDRIKALSIAEAVYDKDVVKTPGSDALVRSEATRLRRVLADYYAGRGASDPVRIEVLRGAYVPQFERVGASAPLRRRKSWTPAMRAALLGAGVVASVALAIVMLLQQKANAPLFAPGSPPAIAVLPFSVVAGSAPIQALGQGIAQEITARMSRFETGLVFSPAVSGNDTDASRVSQRLQQLGAHYALSGMICQSGGGIHVTAQLIDVQQKIVVWAQTYDHDVSSHDLAAAQSDIARDIAVTLGQPSGVIITRELAVAPAGSTDAPGYDCVIGIFEFMRTKNNASRPRLHACLEKTVRVNPGYAAAWAGLSIFDLSSVTERYFAPSELQRTLDKALDEANSAIARSPQSAFAHEALADAQFRRGEDDAFASNAQEALNLNPDDPQLLADIGNKYYCLGRYEDGLALAGRGAALSPVPPSSYYRVLFFDAFRNGRFPQALNILDAMGTGNSVSMRAFRVMALAHTGNSAETRGAVDALLAAARDFTRHENYFLAQWRLGPELTVMARTALQMAGIPPPPENEAALDGAMAHLGAGAKPSTGPQLGKANNK